MQPVPKSEIGFDSDSFRSGQMKDVSGMMMMQYSSLLFVGFATVSNSEDENSIISYSCIDHPVFAESQFEQPCKFTVKSFSDARVTR